MSGDKMMINNPGKYLSIFLWLVAIHSFSVGVGLIVLPYSFMHYLGYEFCAESFFRCQGGVFHIAVSAGYAMAAYNHRKFECLVILAIIIKFAATIFLFIYSFVGSSIAIIVLSGVSDFIMAIVILYLYLRIKKTGKENE